MLIGVAGSILPGLPSTPLVFVAAIGHRLYFGETSAAFWVLTILGILTALSLVLDYAASMYGAKRLGATWRGVVGAIVGGLIGLFFNIPGIILGPLIGAMVFEMAGGREWREASRAGVGATLGVLAGTLGKLICCLLMVGLFIGNVVYRSLSLR